MRIAIINVSIGRGSVGRIVADLYAGLKNAGHEVKLIYGRSIVGEYASEDLMRIGTSKDIYMHALLTRIIGNTAFYSKRATGDLISELELFKPDIVHLHGVYGYYINMEVLFNYLALKEIKVVSTLHSCWDFTGHCCYFDYVRCNQWNSGCKECKQVHAYPYSFIDNTERNFEKKKTLYQSLNYCTIVTPSRWLADYVKESFLSVFPCKVIRNGIDQSIFKPEDVNRRESDKFPTILCVANIWESRKGWNDVVELSKYLEGKAKLIVVGVKGKQKKELSSSTVAIERTDSTVALAKLYQSATVLFNPTYEDNYPTVNLEAISCGTPVITYQTGGSPEALELGKFGWIIQKRDYASLLSITSRVFDGYDSFDTENIGLLSNKHMVDKYLELYGQI